MERERGEEVELARARVNKGAPCAFTVKKKGVGIVQVNFKK